ncbi:O-antigen ligase family protein [Microbacterium sp. ZW T2_14]|uniref:O-antigen ligase family protein n=1 Tax=Microbacterium sp. ZW T2_14 TaxID=3378079 RepID=UPI0038554149
MMSIAVVAAAVIAFLIVWHFKGGAVATTLAMLAGCSLATVDLVTVGHSGALTATATAGVTLVTYHLALLGGLLSMPRLTLRSISPWFLLFLVSVLVLMLGRGLTSPHVVSGFIQWGSAVLAWGVGGAVAASSLRDGKPRERLIAVTIGVIVGWHGVAVGMQLLGLRAVGSVDAGDVDITRASGIAGHSGNLGKIMFVLIMILLPITRSTDRVARRWAVVTIAVSALLTGLSFSRANMAAVVVLVVLWLLLGPGISLAKRLLVPVVGIVVALPILDVLILRNEYDPDGGSRPILMETAWHQISQSLWLGVGPNNYLGVVGQYDPLAAGGLPVHSAFVLALAELGLVSAILIAAPLIGAVVVSLRRLGRRNPARSYAVALLASVPGIVLIASTGWGLLREQYLVILFFAIGYLLSAQRNAADAGGAEVKDRPYEEEHDLEPVGPASARGREPARRDNSLHRSSRRLRR